MSSYHGEKIVQRDGVIVLDNLPFRAGDHVVVVVSSTAALPVTAPNSLQGTVVRYQRPTDPVAEDEWEVLQ